MCFVGLLVFSGFLLVCLFLRLKRPTYLEDFILKKKNKLQNVETGLQDTLSENENVFISVTSLFA